MADQGPLSGHRLGDKYVLGELLGQGGFGAVYKAQHLFLNRPQAIKVLLDQHFGSPRFRERFIREAQTVAALDHTNILPVHDFGVEGSRAYLVMPFIRGGTLQGVLKARSGPLSLDETARYLAQICAALDYAHKRGVVHLDLKPLNLLIHEDGRLLLSDFGLAHLMEQGAVEGGTSLQFGSPVYMAPERFDGKPEQRSDLYALGIILYQLLSGRVPFTGASPIALLRQHLTETPSPLQSVRPELPPTLDAVLNKALAKQPVQRYQTAGELLYDFQAAVAGRLSPQVGGSSAVFYEPTRISPPLPATIRAVNPPVASVAPPTKSAGTGGVTPLQSPTASPVAPRSSSPGIFSRVARVYAVFFPSSVPQKAKVWSGRFAVLCTLITALSIVATIADFRSFGVVLAVICLVGLRFTNSLLIRIGLFLQVVSVVFSLLGLFLRYAGASIVEPIPAVLSMICISYGIARWKASQDVGLMVLQVLVSLGLGVWGLLLGVGLYYALFWAFTSFAVLVLVLRPPCWKAQPLVTLLLALGELWAFFFYAVYIPLPFLGDYPTDVIFLEQFIGLSLGFLLLVQTERIRQKRQKQQPALVQQS